jgi:hypothetical protein
MWEMNLPWFLNPLIQDQKKKKEKPFCDMWDHSDAIS